MSLAGLEGASNSAKAAKVSRSKLVTKTASDKIIYPTHWAEPWMI